MTEVIKDKWKEDYISLFALDIPVEDILKRIGKTQSDILKARLGDEVFDRDCEVALKHQRSVLISKISEIEQKMLKGDYAFIGSGQPNAAIKSLQWRIEYLDAYEIEIGGKAAGVAAKSDAELVRDFLERNKNGTH